MKNYHKVELPFEGHTLSLETGKYAKQADGSIFLKYGNTVLLTTAVASKDEIKEELDFFPLTVDYIEKFYAAGKFPGGFLKRESQPSSDEKLTARIIDRPIRPLFPKWFQNETQVLVTLLSYDENCDPKVLAITAASAALSISDIPFHGPIAGCRIVKKDDEYLVNPAPDKQEDARLNIIMAGNKDSIVMVEGEANEATEEEITEALTIAHKAIQPILTLQEELAAKAGKEKRPEVIFTEDTALKSFVEKESKDLIAEALTVKAKLERYAVIKEHKKALVAKVEEALENNAEFLDTDAPEKVIKRAKKFFEECVKNSMRSMITAEEKRIDGRDLTTVRDIWIETGVLPHVHGSAIFTRGETQSLGAITLGIGTDEQRVDTVTDQYSKPFMLHYNFPSFSVGEVGRLRAPGRREIGHGTLAERALKAIIPSKEEFPYTIRVVSEILESNGSSSQATVCSGSLALMDAGIPFKKHVAGIAMGLIKEESDYFILSDIMGDEDHLGDMDFKVAGTKDGITAIQMDIKIEGLPQEVLERAMVQAKLGRMHIIGKMEEALPTYREQLSPIAPKLHKMNIEPDTIRDLIGTGGKNIKSIIETTGADIEVDQSGVVIIAAKDQEVLDKTIEMVKGFTDKPELGKVYEGEVTRIEEYGAFVTIFGNNTGLLHISKIAEERVNQVEDFIKMGDKVKVIITQLEHDGKFKLSMKPSDFDKDWTKEAAKPRERRDRHSGGNRDKRRRDNH